MKEQTSARYLADGFDRVEGWLSFTAAHIMASLAEQQTKDGILGDIAEIGIHHGKSFLALANAAAPGERLIAIDVFDDQHKNVEYSVLRGAEGIITKHRPIIVSEFSPTAMPGISSVTGEEYLRWLTAKGYRLGVIEYDGAIVNHDTDTDAVMRAFEQSGVDHIDITAQPV